VAGSARIRWGAYSVTQTMDLGRRREEDRRKEEREERRGTYRFHGIS